MRSIKSYVMWVVELFALFMLVSNAVSQECVSYGQHVYPFGEKSVGHQLEYTKALSKLPLVHCKSHRNAAIFGNFSRL